MKSLLGVLLALSSLSSLATAQCTTTSPSNCGSPLGVKQSTPPVPAAIILIDSGLPPPTPAVKQYIVSIKDGVMQESDNAGAYHTLVGPKGDKGDVGATGVVGPQGATGAVGAQGSVGATGAPGATGAAGSQGIQGAQGVQGPTGPQGSPGASGAVGARGLQGVPGVIVGNTITATEVCNLVNGVRTCKLKVLSIQ